jgi:hypothetical protein
MKNVRGSHGFALQQLLSNKAMISLVMEIAFRASGLGFAASDLRASRDSFRK